MSTYSFQGVSPKQTLVSYRDSEDVIDRKTVVKSWNTIYANNKVQGKTKAYGRVTTPFRAVNNLGDYLGRVQYNSGGPNPINRTYPGLQSNLGTMWKNTDNTGISATNCNPKFVSDSSDYTTFRKQQAVNRNYNDYSFGGYNNAAYVATMRVRRF